MTEAIVIIGAGEAGVRAAVSLRERGFKGSISLVGNEEHAPYERPPLSKAVITSELLPDAPKIISNHLELAERSIDFIPNVIAEKIDRSARSVSLSDGRDLQYSKLLLATGALPRRLGVTGASAENILYLRTFSDALKLRHRLEPGSRLIVIGGGFIGLEIAASAIARGCEVTILETAPRLLMRGVPEVVAERITDRHRNAGVDIRTSVEIEEVSGDGKQYSVRLKDGAVLVCDLIVAGIGAIPETHLASACGLAVENGISVDSYLQASDPDIFAAGDCCSFPHQLYDGRRVRLEAWRNAQDQGAIVAANMLGFKTRYSAVPWFWSDQYDETLQVAGLFDPSCSTVERKLDENTSVYFHLAPDGRLLSASAVGANNIIAKEIRIAEMLIALRAHPDAADLSNPSFKLKDLLKNLNKD
ncbi:NAD(P)/FAD-dependent oxidoreductase [Agrobacterium sp. rho-13.3]|uniref:NAD(P)/FAD-dependent oxidoreductase n=1 Tax=Agrobacterium sp. rho-13.3 TaxID=3072980 RepID=UPI002A173204|nr:FAD-dependent oxidoreductase [Agrobacterium sp. rho-13.3]MDX8309227.1 FAD-dependent oxidoreductase [Agrobacterium sp. rho-13.3]